MKKNTTAPPSAMIIAAQFKNAIATGYENLANAPNTAVIANTSAAAGCVAAWTSAF